MYPIPSVVQLVWYEYTLGYADPRSNNNPGYSKCVDSIGLGDNL